LTREGTPCLVALGSNLGDRRGFIVSAFEAIARWPETRDATLSRFWENPAWGGPAGQGDFLNAAALFSIATLEAADVLDRLLAIERRLGRTRTVKNGPRTIDLDLLLFGDRVIDTPDLTVPHGDMHRRSFVLLPAAEVGGFLRHPVLDKTVAELARDLGTVAQMRPLEGEPVRHAVAHPKSR
jgi:2-amino-4-hydroxy-6-hydroxymethyldihydropteridine diphosphokinase